MSGANSDIHFRYYLVYIENDKWKGNTSIVEDTKHIWLCPEPPRETKTSVSVGEKELPLVVFYFCRRGDGCRSGIYSTLRGLLNRCWSAALMTAVII